MHEDRRIRIIAIVALIVGVIGLSIGFSAFTRNLKIENDNTTVNQKNNLSVLFSSSIDDVETDPIIGSVSPISSGASATNANIDNGDGSSPRISGLSATFTEPGQKVTYEFYARNTSDYVAYLKNISFDGTKICNAINGTTQSTVDNACEGISLNIKVGNETATNITKAVSDHPLSENESEKIIIDIEYTEGSKTANGDFTVNFGSITLNYNTVDS